MKNRTARPPRSRFASYPASASRALPVVTGCPASPADRHPRPGCPPTASQSLVSGGHKQQRLRRQRDPWVRRTLGNPRGDAKQRQLIATSDRSAIDILVIGRQSPLRYRRSGLPRARGQPILMAALEHPDMREPCPDQHRDDIGAERRVRARPLADKQLTDEVLGERAPHIVRRPTRGEHRQLPCPVRVWCDSWFAASSGLIWPQGLQQGECKRGRLGWRNIARSFRSRNDQSRPQAGKLGGARAEAASGHVRPRNRCTSLPVTSSTGYGGCTRGRDCGGHHHSPPAVRAAAD